MTTRTISALAVAALLGFGVMFASQAQQMAAGPRDGDPPAGSKDVPSNKFWSLTVYDMETCAFIYTREERPGLSSREIAKMKQNSDGSVTLYVGPKAPKGLENNWIPTAGKAPDLMFRFYEPEEAFYTKTFKLADVQLVNQPKNHVLAVVSVNVSRTVC